MSQSRLPLALLALAVVVLALVIRTKQSQDEPSKGSVVLDGKSHTPALHDPAYRQRVNEHLQQLDRKQLLRQQEQAIEIHKQESIEGISLEPRPLQEPIGLDFKQDSRTAKTAQDVTIPSQKPDARRDLENQVSRSLRDRQIQSEYEKAYEREYIRTFLENARKSGYDLKIDQNLQVIDPTQSK